MNGWTMCVIRTEYGQDVWSRAVAAGIIETRAATEEPNALKVLDALAKKQRRRVDPFDSHAAGRWPVKEVINRVRREFIDDFRSSQQT